MMQTPPFNGEIIPMAHCSYCEKLSSCVYSESLSVPLWGLCSPPHLPCWGGGMMGRQGLPGKRKGAEEHGNKYFSVYNILTHSGLCCIYYIADIDAIFIVHWLLINNMLIINQQTTLMLGSMWIWHFFLVTTFKLSGLRLACMNHPSCGSISATSQIFLIGGTRNRMSPKWK